MGARTQSTERSERRLGPLGWFALLGLLSMGGLYALDVATQGNGVAPTTSLPIGIVAGIGALLLWFGNDPTRP